MNKKILEALEKEHLTFELGEEQRTVLLQVFQCIDTKLPLVTSIVGSAGTGKSTIAKLIIEYLDLQKRKYLLASPTHKAKTVLSKYTNKPAVTLHKLLNLSAVVDILDLNFNNLQFSNKGDSDIPTDGVLIIDECSMINRDLYKFITEKATERNCMIIFIGDLQQLRPVKENKISKSFTDSYPFELTKIYRQKGNNPILDLLDELRTTAIFDFKGFQSSNGSLIKYANWKDLIQSTKPLFEIAVATKNPDYVKLLAYTNNRVEAFNQVIRNELFLIPSEYEVGDLLMGYETTKARYPAGDSLIVNSSDYRVEHAKSTIKNIHGIDCRGWNLRLYSFEDDTSFSAFILSKDNPTSIFQQLAQLIESLRLQAINTTKGTKYTYAKRWKLYYDTLDEFLTPIDLVVNNRVVRKKSLDFSYCITVHKSQGSNFDHLLVDMGNILICKSDEELQQLQYVALSRTKQDIHMVM